MSDGGRYELSMLQSHQHVSMTYGASISETCVTAKRRVRANIDVKGVVYPRDQKLVVRSVNSINKLTKNAPEHGRVVINHLFELGHSVGRLQSRIDDMRPTFSKMETMQARGKECMSGGSMTHLFARKHALQRFLLQNYDSGQINLAD